MDVIAWLLDADPAIRWQVLRDLLDAPEAEVAAERARLLALQRPDGQWASGTPTCTSAAAATWWHALPPDRRGTLFPQGTSTAWSLVLLRDCGLDPGSAVARRAVRLVRDRCRREHDGESFFAGGEAEPCINGRMVALGAYFGEDVQDIVDRLLGVILRPIMALTLQVGRQPRRLCRALVSPLPFPRPRRVPWVETRRSARRRGRAGVAARRQRGRSLGA